MLSCLTKDAKFLCLKYTGRIFSSNSLISFTKKLIPLSLHVTISECSYFYIEYESTSRISKAFEMKLGTECLSFRLVVFLSVRTCESSVQDCCRCCIIQCIAYKLLLKQQYSQTVDSPHLKPLLKLFQLMKNYRPLHFTQPIHQRDHHKKYSLLAQAEAHGSYNNNRNSSLKEKDRNKKYSQQQVRSVSKSHQKNTTSSQLKGPNSKDTKEKVLNYSAKTQKKYFSPKKTAVVGFQQQNEESPQAKKFLNKIQKLKKKLSELKKMHSKNSPKKKSKPKRQDQEKKIKSPNNKKNKSKSQKHHSLKKQKRQKDFVLIGQDILAIQDSQQLQRIISKQKNKQPHPKKSVRAANQKCELGKQIQKYIKGMLQIQKHLKQLEQNEVDILLFKIHDMESQEKLRIYEQLQMQLHIQHQLNIQQNTLETIIRSSVQIVEHKHKLAKAIVDRMEVTSVINRAQINQKISQLNQWKSKKFREIMSAKTFLEKNTKSEYQNNGQEDLLKNVNNNLQQEFEQMLTQNFYEPIQTLRKPQKNRNELEAEIESSLFVVQNNNNVYGDFLEQMKRAKQIKDSARAAIEIRLTEQQHSSSSMSTNPRAMIYLIELTKYILQNYEIQYFQATSKDLQETFLNGLFVKFQQAVVGIGNSSQQRRHKYYQHIYNKALFDCFNKDVNKYYSNMLFLVDTAVLMDEQPQTLEFIRKKTYKNATELCGLLVEGIPERLLPLNMNQNERKFCQQCFRNELDAQNMKRSHKSINEEIKQILNCKIEQDLQLRLQICEEVFSTLIAELVFRII